MTVASWADMIEQRRLVAREVGRTAAGGGKVDVDVAADCALATLEYIGWPDCAATLETTLESSDSVGTYVGNIIGTVLLISIGLIVIAAAASVVRLALSAAL